MPITGIGLAFTLVGALAWAIFDALRKRLAREVSPVYLALLLPLAQAPLLALWAATREPFGLPLTCLPPLAASALLNGLALVLFLEALRLSPAAITQIRATPEFAEQPELIAALEDTWRRR